MRILWFNWRDIKNPDAGGAEVFTHEVIQRLVRKGYDITLFSSAYEGCVSNENVDGVRTVREGGKYSVYRKAIKYYEQNSNSYDLVIDEVNTRPFLTPKFVKGKPILAVVHQLAHEFWFYETSFPLNYIGYYYLERKWLSYYRNVPTITVSNSSKTDLEELGFKDVSIVPEGLSISPLMRAPTKETQPTIAFLGRLKKAKLPHHALQAFSIIKEEIPDSRMWIIGDGYMKDELSTKNIRNVTFFGKTDNKSKYELLSRAHLLLVPAVREGWGLVVTESNAMGTPAVAYDVPGLRDSVKDGITGMLAKENSPASLAKMALSLLKDRDLRDRLSSNALEDARAFSWDNTADAFDEIIKDKV